MVSFTPNESKEVPLALPLKHFLKQETGLGEAISKPGIILFIVRLDCKKRERKKTKQKKNY